MNVQFMLPLDWPFRNFLFSPQLIKLPLLPSPLLREPALPAFIFTIVFSSIALPVRLPLILLDFFLPFKVIL